MRRAVAGLFALLAVAALCTRQPGWPGVVLVLLPFTAAVAALLLDVRQGSLRARLALKAAAVLLCALLAFAATQCWGRQPSTILWMAEQPLHVLLALLLIFALFALFFALTGSLPVGIIVTTALLAAISLAGYLVYKMRGSYLVPSDIMGLRTAAEVAGAYDFSPDGTMLLIVLSSACAIALAPKTRLPFRPRLRGKVFFRAGALLCALLVLFTALSPRALRRFGLSPYYWDQSQSAEFNGNFVNFMSNMPDLYVRPPDGYSPDDVAALAAGWPCGSAQNAETQQPDVILILGESWGRVAPADKVQTTLNATPFMDSFGALPNTVSASMVVSTFGASTSQPEFEVLTGTSSAYGLSSAPYNMYVNSALPSLASGFKQLGYTARAVHNGAGASWNRNKAYSLLGFDDFISMGEFTVSKPKIRDYISDTAVFNQAFKMLETGGDAPQFLFCLTISTHGGYKETDYDSPVRITNLDGKYPQAEQYLGLLHETDAAFASFIEKLGQRSRPTVVLAFGDHLPAIEETYLKQVLPEGRMARYTTPLYIWANYSLPQGLVQNGDTISSNYVGALLTQLAGQPATGYQQFLWDAKSRYPVVSQQGCVDAEGKFTSSAKMAGYPTLADEAALQYALVFDKNDYPTDFFTFPGGTGA